MSINSIIGSGLSALLANQAALKTTSSNIANLNTPDYVRRIVNFETQTAGGELGGVNLSSVTRAVDGFLNTQRWSAASSSGETDVADRFLDQLQRSLGGLADGRDPVSRLGSMTAGLAELATDPTSQARRADLLGKMRDFAQGVSDLAAKTQDLRQQADQEIGETVGRINALVKQISDLNTPIQQATVNGDLSTALRDQRDAALRELSGLIEIQVDENVSGRVTVATPTGLTLVSSNIADISHQAFSTGSPSATYPEMMVTRRDPVSGAVIGTPEALERNVTGGKLRGLLDMRDNILPDIAAQVGELAAGTAEAFNAAHNASTTYPAPATLAGRDTGLLAGDALGFTGKTTVAVVDAQGKLVRRVNVDFSAGTLSVDGGAASAIGTTIGSFVTALNGALGGTGSASFVNGKLSLSASGGNGVAVQQDPATPSDRAGRGFAQAFGLNDIFVSTVPTSFATGLGAADAHGFTAGQQAQFQLRNADGSVAGSFTYAVAGATIGDVVTGLNSAAAGAGTFSLDGQGRMTFAAAGGSSQRLETIGDDTKRGGTSLSLTAMFGLGQRYQMEQASGLTLRPDLAQTPSKLSLAQMDLTSTSAVGDIVLASADNKGVLALQAASSQASFGAAGGMGAMNASLSQYATALVAGIGQKSAAATSASSDAASFKGEIEQRAAEKEGVNLDEELANMMVYQQAYNAGARLITTAQQLYDVLLAMMR